MRILVVKKEGFAWDLLPIWALLLFFVLLPMWGCAPGRQGDAGLENWPEGKSPLDVGTRLAEDFLRSPHTLFGDRDTSRKPQYITYPDVCAWLGGLWFAQASANPEMAARFEERFLPLLDADSQLLPRPNHVDNNVFGAVPLELYLQTQKKPFLHLGLMYADTQWDLPAEASPADREWARKGYSWQTRVWIDDMFMITAVQAQAFRTTGDPGYIDRAAREMVFYLDTIQLDNGLFYHSPEAPFIWGRGNGWMAAGTAELLRLLPRENPHYPRIMEGYRLMMNALLKYQSESGMWRQIVDDPEAWEESSSTAMFTYAFITGVKNGWLDPETYGAAARKGWLALVSHLDENDHITDVCAGTPIGKTREYYLDRPRITGDLHGQAPFLWCAVALLR
jgi:rhamnogalacturonyl hydrolase YesR